jgi:ferredoxin, 2Fe-2S
MVNIIFVEPCGKERTIDVPEGHSVMEGAIANGIRGIIAECGGACSCATCHVHVDESWINAVGKASGDEADILEFVDYQMPNSRLTCQIEVEDALDGLRVLIPKQQS